MKSSQRERERQADWWCSLVCLLIVKQHIYMSLCMMRSEDIVDVWSPGRWCNGAVYDSIFIKYTQLMGELITHCNRIFREISQDTTVYTCMTV